VHVFITGGSGFLGQRLVRALRARGDAVTVLSRSGGAAAALSPLGIATVQGDPAQTGTWQARVAGCDAAVNLAGEPVGGGRWTAERQARIRDSRIRSTENLVAALQAAPRPRVLISSSGIGYYGAQPGHALDPDLDESSPGGHDFLARVTTEWEAAARPAAAVTRLVLLRTGLVLGTDGGALPRLLTPFRLGLGGPLGHGRQWYSWIHANDWTRLVLYALDHDIAGPLNATAPEPVPMRQFAHALGHALHRPAVLPVPAAALRLLMGDMASLVLTGQRVWPRAALAAGFTFQYPRLQDALRDLLGKVVGS